MELSLDEEAEALRRSATKGRRLLLFAVVGHVLVLMTFVGLPYLRGRSRANAGKHRLANYVACLVGGDPAVAPGLTLPDGALEHYADAAQRSQLQQCQGTLEALAPDEVFWLLPSTRHAEAEVRRAAAMAGRELSALGNSPSHETPERPWLALQRVIASFTLWMEAADVQGNIFEPCVVFRADARSVRPEIIPLQAASSASVDMRTRADGVAILAVDQRGISWVRVGAGSLDPRRLRRPGLVRGARFLRGEPWLVWATADERCRPHCAHRAMGVARLDASFVETPIPFFVAAHPAGTIAESLQLSDDYLWVAAKRARGVGVVRFDRAGIEDDTEESHTDEVQSPLLGELVAPPRALRMAYLLEASAEGLWGIDDDARLVDGRGRVRAEDVTWFLPAGPSVFVGSPDGVFRIRRGFFELEDLALPGIRDARVAFEGERAAVAGTAGGILHVARCKTTTCQSVAIEARDDVVSFQLAFSDDGLVIAHSATNSAGEIRVQAWNDELGSPVVPAPCWSENGGFCTPMVMTSRDGRVVLGGRDEQDLLAIETRDGVSWRRLVGLR